MLFCDFYGKGQLLMNDKNKQSVKDYFSKGELILWGTSTGLILLSFCIFDRENFLTLGASIVGVTSLIFAAKGNPAGQALMVLFSMMYGVISYSFRYYGEMITYLGMTAPMSLFSLVSWLRNPYNGNRSQVKINRLRLREFIFAALLTGAVTAVFYFVLKYFDTPNLWLSTLSVTTSFAAVYLTFRRSAYYALAYAANDIILIILWILAALSDISYLSVIICFCVFLVNDIYGFINWTRLGRQQKS